MRSDGRPVLASARSPYDGAGPKVLKAASSTPVVPARQSPGNRTEDAVGAERLWWSDYCEQKLQELQGSFTKEIHEVVERLQADLRFSEDRLSELVESEKASRLAQLGDLRRELEHQGAEMAEVVRSQVDVRNQMTTLKGPELRPMAESTAQSEGTRSPAASTSVAAASAEGVRQTSLMDAALADLRRELQLCQEHSFNQNSELEQLLNNLKRDLAEVQEKVSLHSKASDEQRSLQKVISQFADLGRGIEELNTGMLTVETTLRQETERVDKQLRTELEELQHAQKQMSQSLKDERDARGRETGIFRSLLESSGNRLDQVEKDLGAYNINKVLTTLEENSNELAQLQLAQCRLQAQCSSRSPTAGTALAIADANGEANVSTSTACMTEGDFLLRFEAMEAKVEAQVPRSLNLESQIKALSNDVNKRFHDLDSQMRKNNFDAASVFVRLDSMEQETLKLSKDCTESQSIRADVEALKRRFVAGERRGDVNHSESAARRRALLPPELRENISNLVQKVDEAVSQPLPGDEVTSDTGTGSFHSGAKSGSVDLAEQLQQLRDGTMSEEAYRQALQVVQQLRQQNESLREKNAELAEEVFPDHRPVHMSGPPETMMPEMAGGSALLPPQFPRHMRSSSPAQMTRVVPVQAVPAVPGGVIHTSAPVIVARVAPGTGVARTASPERRQYF